MRRRLAANVMLGLAATLLFGAAPAFARARISAKTSVRVVNYRTPAPTAVKIRGRLSTGKRRVVVVLQAKRWPFSEKFRRVARTRTGRHGSYHFTQRPTIATRYRVLAPRQRARSRVRTVYAHAGNKNVSCTLSGHGQTVPCSRSLIIHGGKYTLHISFDWIYPPAFFPSEIGLPVYFYYGQVNGTQEPRAISLQRTVGQRPAGGSLGHVTVSHRITVPATNSTYLWTFCIQTQERRTGFGRPGLPGRRHCGAPTITRPELRRGLG